GLFLKNPARWKEIWHANPKIKNPNKIYPGDVIAYRSVGGVRKLQVAGSSNPIRGKFTGRRTSDGRPVYNLSPTVRTEALAEPIPAVPKDIVYPFMTKNLVVEPGFSQEYPYIVGQADGNFIALTGRQEVYAKSDDDAFSHELYDVFRESSPIKDPQDGEMLGVEAVYVGQLKLVKPANEDGIGTFMQTETVNPLYPKDILIPSVAVEAGGDLNFMPKLPNLTEDNVMVIRPIGAMNNASGSQFSTILVNVGSDDGMTAGDVFKVVRAQAQTGVGRDGERYHLPDYEVGLAMVYKTYDEVSYALIMNAYDVVYPGDRLIRP
ncbi:MAG: hypothetical protein CR977_02645, partial [Gammaproteobacteria bacterium]